MERRATCCTKLAIFAPVLAIVAGVTVLYFSRAIGKVQIDWHSVACGARETPLRLPVNLRSSINLGNAELVALSKRMLPRSGKKLSASFVLHILRVCGPAYEVSLPGSSTTQPLLSLVTDERLGASMFGSPSMVITDFGVRYTDVEPFGRSRNTREAGESHRDQFLAVMAELGIPLSQPIVMSAGKRCVRNVLSDSLAQFHVKQDELAWTAYAYACYLPPQKTWENRFQEKFSFDDISNELLSQPIGRGACCGTHILFALTAIASADSTNSILDPSVRRRIKRRLDEWLEQVIQNQRPDGGWDPDWSVASGAPRLGHNDATKDVVHRRLLATSHLAEWLSILPASFQVPESTLDAAAEFLLENLRAAEDEEILQQFCPFSHACHVLMQNSSRSK